MCLVWSASDSRAGVAMATEWLSSRRSTLCESRTNIYWINSRNKLKNWVSLSLSCPDKGDKSHSSGYGESGPHRAPLTERNTPPRAGASLSTPETAAKTVKKSGQNIQIKAPRSLKTFTLLFSRRFYPKRLTNEDNGSNQNQQRRIQCTVKWCLQLYNCIIIYSLE